MNRPWAKLIFFVFILYFIQIFNPNSWNPNQSLRLSTKLAANIIKKFEFDMIFVVRFKSDQHRCLNLDGLESESLTIRFRKPNRLSLLSKCWCFWLFWSILSFLSFFLLFFFFFFLFYLPFLLVAFFVLSFLLNIFLSFFFLSLFHSFTHSLFFSLIRSFSLFRYCLVFFIKLSFFSFFPS